VVLVHSPGDAYLGIAVLQKPATPPQRARTFATSPQLLLTASLKATLAMIGGPRDLARYGRLRTNPPSKSGRQAASARLPGTAFAVCLGGPVFYSWLAGER
jgi:hypothetical protein